MGNSCFAWLSCGVFGGVLFLLFFSPQDVLDEIWDLIESVLAIFPTYFCDLLIIVLDIMPFQIKLFFSRKRFFFLLE